MKRIIIKYNKAMEYIKNIPQERINKYKKNIISLVFLIIYYYITKQIVSNSTGFIKVVLIIVLIVVWFKVNSELRGNLN